MRQGHQPYIIRSPMYIRGIFLTYQKGKGMVMSQCHHPAPPLLISSSPIFFSSFFASTSTDGRSPHSLATCWPPTLECVPDSKGGAAWRRRRSGSTSEQAECPGFVSHRSLRTLVFPRIHSVSYRASSAVPPCLLVVDIIMSLSSRVLWRCRKTYPHYQVLVKWGRGDFFSCCLQSVGVR